MRVDFSYLYKDGLGGGGIVDTLEEAINFMTEGESGEFKQKVVTFLDKNKEALRSGKVLNFETEDAFWEIRKVEVRR